MAAIKETAPPKETAPIKEMAPIKELAMEKIRTDIDRPCNSHQPRGDALGNLFWLIVDRLPGRDRTARTRQLFIHIQVWYDEHDVQDLSLIHI